MAAAVERQVVRSRLGGAWTFFVGAGLVMAAHGLQGTLIPVRATIEGFPVLATGAVMSGYFVGLLMGSAFSPDLVRQVGHVRLFAACASLASVSILMHPLFVDAAVWTAMRVATGFCYAGMYVVVESWLNQRATNQSRGRLLSLYMITVFSGMAAGQLLLNVASPRSADLFIAVSILVSLALVPLLLAARPGPRPRKARRMTVCELYRASPLGATAAVLNGVSNGAFFGMAPVYAQAVGIPVPQVAWFMALATLGGLFSQWPLGWLSDRFDRRRVMLGVVLVGAAAIAAQASPLVDPAGTAAFALVFVFGAAVLPLYSLTISHVNDYVSTEQMVGASGRLVFLSGSGLVAGPVIVSFAVDFVGPAGFLGLQVSALGCLAAFIVYRMLRRAAKPVEEQAGYVPSGPRASPVALALAAEEGRELAGGEAAPAPEEAPPEAPETESPEAESPAPASRAVS